MKRPFVSIGTGVLLLAAVGLGAAGQPRWWGRFDPAADNLPYDGRLIFTRIRYDSPGAWGFGRVGGSSWNHDYPQADRHLPRILEHLTTIDVRLDGSNILTLDDPALFSFPIVFISEPGFWAMTDAEAAALRQYLLKGGFAIFDDFEAEQWYNFEAQLKRVLPEYRLIEIDVTHPVFQSFFAMETLDIPHPLVRVTPSYHALFENNDPAGRMLAIANYNNDIAEYWEWSDTGWLPIDLSNEAYKLGVNYFVYAMTH